MLSEVNMSEVIDPPCSLHDLDSETCMDAINLSLVSEESMVTAKSHESYLTESANNSKSEELDLELEVARQGSQEMHESAIVTIVEIADTIIRNGFPALETASENAHVAETVNLNNTDNFSIMSDDDTDMKTHVMLSYGDSEEADYCVNISDDGEDSELSKRAANLQFYLATKSPNKSANSDYILKTMTNKRQNYQTEYKLAAGDDSEIKNDSDDELLSLLDSISEKGNNLTKQLLLSELESELSAELNHSHSIEIDSVVSHLQSDVDRLHSEDEIHAALQTEKSHLEDNDIIQKLVEELQQLTQQVDLTEASSSFTQSQICEESNTASSTCLYIPYKPTSNENDIQEIDSNKDSFLSFPHTPNKPPLYGQTNYGIEKLKESSDNQQLYPEEHRTPASVNSNIVSSHAVKYVESLIKKSPVTTKYNKAQATLDYIEDLIRNSSFNTIWDDSLEKSEPSSLNNSKNQQDSEEKVENSVSNVTISSSHLDSVNNKESIDIVSAKPLKRIHVHHEPVGRWKALSTKPILTQEDVFELQNSLGNAAMENEILQSKINDVNAELTTKVSEMSKFLAETKSELKTSNETILKLQKARQDDKVAIAELQIQLTNVKSVSTTMTEENDLLKKQLEEAIRLLKETRELQKPKDSSTTQTTDKVSQTDNPVIVSDQMDVKHATLEMSSGTSDLYGADAGECESYLSTNIQDDSQDETLPITFSVAMTQADENGHLQNKAEGSSEPDAEQHAESPDCPRSTEINLDEPKEKTSEKKICQTGNKILANHFELPCQPVYLYNSVSPLYNNGLLSHMIQGFSFQIPSSAERSVNPIVGYDNVVHDTATNCYPQMSQLGGKGFALPAYCNNQLYENIPQTSDPSSVLGTDVHDYIMKHSEDILQSLATSGEISGGINVASVQYMNHSSVAGIMQHQQMENHSSANEHKLAHQKLKSKDTSFSSSVNDSQTHAAESLEQQSKYSTKTSETKTDNGEQIPEKKVMQAIDPVSVKSDIYLLRRQATYSKDSLPAMVEVSSLPRVSELFSPPRSSLSNNKSKCPEPERNQEFDEDISEMSEIHIAKPLMTSSPLKASHPICSNRDALLSPIPFSMTEFNSTEMACDRELFADERLLTTALKPEQINRQIYPHRKGYVTSRNVEEELDSASGKLLQLSYGFSENRLGKLDQNQSSLEENNTADDRMGKRIGSHGDSNYSYTDEWIDKLQSPSISDCDSYNHHGSVSEDVHKCITNTLPDMSEHNYINRNGNRLNANLLYRKALERKYRRDSKKTHGKDICEPHIDKNHPSVTQYAPNERRNHCPERNDAWHCKQNNNVYLNKPRNRINLNDAKTASQLSYDSPPIESEEHESNYNQIRRSQPRSGCNSHFQFAVHQTETSEDTEKLQRQNHNSEHKVFNPVNPNKRINTNSGPQQISLQKPEQRLDNRHSQEPCLRDFQTVQNKGKYKHLVRDTHSHLTALQHNSVVKNNSCDTSMNKVNSYDRPYHYDKYMEKSNSEATVKHGSSDLDYHKTVSDDTLCNDKKSVPRMTYSILKKENPCQKYRSNSVDKQRNRVHYADEELPDHIPRSSGESLSTNRVILKETLLHKYQATNDSKVGIITEKADMDKQIHEFSHSINENKEVKNLGESKDGTVEHFSCSHDEEYKTVSLPVDITSPNYTVLPDTMINSNENYPFESADLNDGNDSFPMISNEAGEHSKLTLIQRAYADRLIDKYVQAVK